MSEKEYIKDQVDIITLNYNTKDILPLLFDSLKKITYKNHKLYMVDNGSKDGSADFVEEKYPEVKVFRLEKNYFFSKGNNHAIDRTNGEFILLVNNDIVVEPDFLDHAVARIKTDEKIAGVATKMMLYQNPTILDSVGTVMMPDGSPFNRGIGQPDVGQYDVSEQTYGACFGCVLIRRQYYENEVGPIDNMYFGYFEDQDWSYRVNLKGFKIVTEPKAKVYHAHSVTTRKNIPMWKYYLIQRNFIWTIQKDFEPRRAIKRTIRRYQHLLKDLKRRKSFTERWTIIKVIFVTMINLPRVLLKRRVAQRNRKVWDNDIFRFSNNEFPFFEDVNYRAVYTLDNLENAFVKIRNRDQETKEIYRKIVVLNREKGFDHGGEWAKEVEELLQKLEANYIDKSEIENFRKDILIDKIWFMG
jgi:GT2 family glycosyltransferase